jgi:hypothetical protein
MEKSVKVSIMGMLLPGALLLSAGRRQDDEGVGLEFKEENMFKCFLASSSFRR